MRIRKPGIYAIFCTTTGVPYIGSTVNTDYRLRTHLKSLHEGKHHSIKLQRACNKYGALCFIPSILEHCNESDLISREQFYIEAWDSYAKGYNCTLKAGATRGVRQSPESVAKRQATIQKRFGGSPNKGRKATEETKELIKKARAQQTPPSQETRKAIGNKSKGNTYRTGIKWSDKEREKRKRYWENDANKEQHKKRTSQGMRNSEKWHSLDRVAIGVKVADKLRNRPLTPEHCQKLSEAHKGLPGNNVKTYTLISPEGKCVTIVNLKQFCEEHGLAAAHLNAVFHGKRKQHKGWTK